MLTGKAALLKNKKLGVGRRLDDVAQHAEVTLKFGTRSLPGVSNGCAI
jgi:hypothetical protein